MMQLTVLPMNIETMSQAVIDEFATFLAEVNVRFDVPILLRYGHEMNGKVFLSNNMLRFSLL